MPIRFRCPNCRQLLGIARRKSGTAVECPTCQRSVTVPDKDDPDLALEPPAERAPESPANPQTPAGPMPVRRDLFERSDFDIELPKAARPAPVPIAPAPSRELAPPAPAPASGVTPMTPGIVLSPTQATVLTVTAILLLAVAFGVGLLVGRFLI
jgi:hypothetical protein